MQKSFIPSYNPLQFCLNNFSFINMSSNLYLFRKKYVICLLKLNPGEFFLFSVSLTALIEQDNKGENV